MNSAATMKRKLTGLSRRYQTALQTHLEAAPGARGAGIPAALDVGRRALALGLETLALARLHESALIALMVKSKTPHRSRAQLTKRAGMFFAQAITPIEKFHRTALETNAQLTGMVEMLSRRRVELAASNRRLKREITQRRGVEKALRNSQQHYSQALVQSQQLQEQLRLLSRELLSAQEDERRKISRELHDGIVQILTGINVQLATLKTESATNIKGIAKRIARTQRLVVKSVEIVHRFARELRPPVLDDLGLIPALLSFIKIFAARTGIRVHLKANAGIEKLNGVQRTVLYRVAQEALTNVDHHAQASRVTVNLHKLPRAVRMEIIDNGKSFPVEKVLQSNGKQRLGLLGMRERVEMVGGRFAIESVPGTGTTVCAQIPMQNGKREVP
jgi:two-component system, NarL family, sensor histidine kinase DegS